MESPDYSAAELKRYKAYDRAVINLANTFAAYDRAVDNEAASAILWGVAKRAIYNAVAELGAAASKARQQKKAGRRARKFLLMNKKAAPVGHLLRCLHPPTGAALGLYPYIRATFPRYPGGKIPFKQPPPAPPQWSQKELPPWRRTTPEAE